MLWKESVDGVRRALGAGRTLAGRTEKALAIRRHDAAVVLVVILNGAQR